MIPEEQGPSEAAIQYADDFAAAAVAKLDALFGAGYAKANPQAFAAYMAACSANLNSFMVAATSLDGEAYEEALMAYEEEIAPPPPPHHKGGKRR